MDESHRLLRYSEGHIEKPQRDGGLGERNMNACNVSR